MFNSNFLLNQTGLTRSFLVLSVLVLVGSQIAGASALSQADINSVRDNTAFFDPSDSADCSTTNTSNSSSTLIGSDNEQKAWNFFKSKGLDDLHVAAIIGNFIQESHLDPLIIQGGGESKVPSDAGSGGWGISQWTPGGKVVSIAQKLNIGGNIYDLSTQLNIVWAEMANTSPAGAQNIIVPFKKITVLADAVSYFTTYYEAAGVIGPRLADAQAALAKYGGSASTGGPSTTSSGSSSGCSTATSASSLSPDCKAAIGSAKIICAAKVYDPASYSETTTGGHQGGAAWHAAFPTVNANSLLDCSGLVNIAVYDAFGTDLRENTNGEAADTQYWQHIASSALQPGDLIQPNPGHVEIVDHVSGSTVYTFGAHTSRVPQPDQVGPTQYSISDVNLALHWIGK